jgi:cytochrome c-type biogenesis protein CcmH/NrfG
MTDTAASTSAPVVDKVETSKPADASADTKKDADDKTESNIYSYVFTAVLAVVLIFLLYYAYCRFAENSVTEPYVKGQEQERDDPVVDFNLRESIKELQNLQRQVMKTISENSEF